MTHFYENNKLTFYKHSTSLIVINETNGSSLTIANFGLPKNQFDIETILLLGGLSLLD